MDYPSDSDPRRGYIISKLPANRRGLEIAPYFNPIVDDRIYDVFYVDCIDNEEIQRKAAANPGAVNCHIPKIDAVWKPGKSLAKCVAGRKFAYAVASHVMEHVPNPLGWLREILECLETGGTLAILLPDRRGTMDYYRRETTFAEIVGWSIENPQKPTPTQIMDFLSQSFKDTGTLPFGEGMPPFEDAPRAYTDQDAINFARMAKESGTYIDAHVSVWTPTSFTGIFERLVSMGLLPVEIEGPFQKMPGFHPAEFLVFLKKTIPSE
jgi:SAM-dependent methyltransferase